MQELTIEMFQDDEDDTLSATSRENLIEPPPLSRSIPFGQHDYTFSGGDEDELLDEVIGEPHHGVHDSDSQASRQKLV